MLSRPRRCPCPARPVSSKSTVACSMYQGSISGVMGSLDDSVVSNSGSIVRWIQKRNLKVVSYEELTAVRNKGLA
jgi:hypothetical protein